MLLAPDKEHEKVFPNVSVAGFCNEMSLKDYLIRAALPKMRCEPRGKKTCLVCNSIRTTTTFTTEACGEIFEIQGGPLNCIQSGPLNCNSEKVLDLLEKPKLSFDIVSITI